MKKIILLSFLLCSLYANEAQLQQQIDKLKQEIELLKKHQSQHIQEYDEVYDMAERAEANSFADKIKFGLGFKTYLDNFDKKYTDGTTIRNNNILSTKVMLNAYAFISDSMKFYGRFSMYKYWGSTYIHPYSSYDNMQGRVPADSGLYVERAYLDWFFFKDSILPLALTIGRQPSGDGPSHQFKDNVTRKATYSALLYDGASDGAVVTFDLSKILDYEKTYLRFGYAKGFCYTQTSLDTQNAYIGPRDTDLKDTNVYGVFLDTILPNTTNSLVQLSYSKMVDIVANPLDSNSSNNVNIGDVSLIGMMIEIENIAKSNFDFFAHYAHSIAKPNGNGYEEYGGLLSENGDKSTKTGDAFWIGGRYGFGEKQRYKIGLEYNHGSKYWVSLTQGAFDIYNKLATRGDAYELYLMYVVNRYASVRAGIVNIDYKYSRSGWFVGKPENLDTTITSQIDLLRSIYLKLNVNF